MNKELTSLVVLMLSNVHSLSGQRLFWGNPNHVNLAVEQKRYENPKMGYCTVPGMDRMLYMLQGHLDRERPEYCDVIRISYDSKTPLPGYRNISLELDAVSDKGNPVKLLLCLSYHYRGSKWELLNGGGVARS